jgi:hypothetical protein
MNYIKGKGILVGTFNEEDIANGNDKFAVKKLAEQTGYKYTNTEFIKKNGKVVGMKIYVCDVNDFKL